MPMREEVRREQRPYQLTARFSLSVLRRGGRFTMSSPVFTH